MISRKAVEIHLGENVAIGILILLPKGGVQVSPGEVYTIELIGVDGVFGWKYVMGGYRKGAASAPFGSTPPLPDTRSTFLFKTFRN
jgi:hypothetical protein